MEISIKTVDGITVVTIVGEIDGRTAPDVHRRVSAALEATSKILFDMSQVQFMSSAGLRMLLSVYRQVSRKNGRVALAGLYEEIRDTMSVTGFLGHFPTYTTVDEGLAAIR